MENSELSTEQSSSCPTEGGVPASQSGTQEGGVDQNNVQSMYCKELVLGGDPEFSFEELLAQRYYKKLKEKVTNLHKVKEELQGQIDQKQKLIKGRTDAIQHRHVGASQHSHPSAEVSSAAVPDEAALLSIYSEPEICRNSSTRNRNGVSGLSPEDMGPENNVKPKSLQPPKSFAAYGETVLPEKPIEKPNTRSFAASLNSLKLPTSTLKCRQPGLECPNEKDASLSRSEEAIIHAHWNKTLCRSPDDTCDFGRAAQLASTPFGGPERRNQSERDRIRGQESLDKTGSVIFKEPHSDARGGTNKLGPIQEISHEWGYNSLASTYLLQPESQARAKAQSGIPEVFQPLPEQATSAPPAFDTVSETANPCSLAVRTALLDDLDLSSIANFSKKVGRVPDTEDLQLDGETLFFLQKIGDRGMRLYFSNGGSLLVKGDEQNIQNAILTALNTCAENIKKELVDESTVPWDFYINTQLRARLPADQQHRHTLSTCYLYENGSFTLWQVPQGQTIQNLLEDDVDTRHVPLLALRLLEMVKRLHSCQLVHGGFQPETLMVCHSCDDRVICLDFSNSLDLALQTDVKTVQSLPSAQDYIKQGLLLPSANPYQVDLCSIAEMVHLLLFRTNMRVIKEDSYWILADDCGPLDWQRTPDPRIPLDPLWQGFFHNLLNPEDNSTEFILTNLIDNLNTLSENLECPVFL